MTTVGLLLCDHLDPHVVERVGDYTELFPDAFVPAGIDLRIYEVTRGEFPRSTDECEAWVTSGSRRSCYEDEAWIHQLHDFARDLARQRRPHVGICFGHQLIARALGGVVEPAGSGWGIGAKTFTVTDPTPWMRPPPESFTILMSHRDQVTRLPEGATVVAGADYCPVGAYRIEDHVFCVQGHPEFVPELCRLLIEKRRETIGAPVDEALESLELPLDHRLVVGWMAEFLRR
jgi:GMP synthase-like glutamine amidotransferase